MFKKQVLPGRQCDIWVKILLEARGVGGWIGCRCFLCLFLTYEPGVSRAG